MSTDSPTTGDVTTAGALTPDPATTDEAATDAVPTATDVPVTGGPLLDGADLERRWQQVQASFVDEPRQAVVEADALISETVTQLTSALAARRPGLGATGAKDGSDTESLRIALRGYRDVFHKLLEV